MNNPSFEPITPSSFQKEKINNTPTDLSYGIKSFQQGVERISQGVEDARGEETVLPSFEVPIANDDADTRIPTAREIIDSGILDHVPGERMSIDQIHLLSQMLYGKEYADEVKDKATEVSQNQGLTISQLENAQSYDDEKYKAVRSFLLPKSGRFGLTYDTRQNSSTFTSELQSSIENDGSKNKAERVQIDESSPDNPLLSVSKELEQLATTPYQTEDAMVAMAGLLAATQTPNESDIATEKARRTDILNNSKNYLTTAQAQYESNLPGNLTPSNSRERVAQSFDSQETREVAQETTIESDINGTETVIRAISEAAVNDLVENHKDLLEDVKGEQISTQDAESLRQELLNLSVSDRVTFIDRMKAIASKARSPEELKAILDPISAVESVQFIRNYSTETHPGDSKKSEALSSIILATLSGEGSEIASKAKFKEIFAKLAAGEVESIDLPINASGDVIANAIGLLPDQLKNTLSEQEIQDLFRNILGNPDNQGNYSLTINPSTSENNSLFQLRESIFDSRNVGLTALLNKTEESAGIDQVQTRKNLERFALQALGMSFEDTDEGKEQLKETVNMLYTLVNPESTLTDDQINQGYVKFSDIAEAGVSGDRNILNTSSTLTQELRSQLEAVTRIDTPESVARTHRFESFDDLMESIFPGKDVDASDEDLKEKAGFILTPSGEKVSSAEAYARAQNGFKELESKSRWEKVKDILKSPFTKPKEALRNITNGIKKIAKMSIIPAASAIATLVGGPIVPAVVAGGIAVYGLFRGYQNFNRIKELHHAREQIGDEEKKKFLGMSSVTWAALGGAAYGTSTQLFVEYLGFPLAVAASVAGELGISHMIGKQGKSKAETNFIAAQDKYQAQVKDRLKGLDNIVSNSDAFQQNFKSSIINILGLESTASSTEIVRAYNAYFTDNAQNVVALNKLGITVDNYMQKIDELNPDQDQAIQELRQETLKAKETFERASMNAQAFILGASTTRAATNAMSYLTTGEFSFGDNTETEAPAPAAAPETVQTVDTNLQNIENTLEQSLGEDLTVEYETDSSGNVTGLVVELGGTDGDPSSDLFIPTNEPTSLTAFDIEDLDFGEAELTSPDIDTSSYEEAFGNSREVRSEAAAALRVNPEQIQFVDASPSADLVGGNSYIEGIIVPDDVVNGSTVNSDEVAVIVRDVDGGVSYKDPNSLGLFPSEVPLSDGTTLSDTQTTIQVTEDGKVEFNLVAEIDGQEVTVAKVSPEDGSFSINTDLVVETSTDGEMLSTPDEVYAVQPQDGNEVLMRQLVEDLNERLDANLTYSDINALTQEAQSNGKYSELLDQLAQTRNDGRTAIQPGDRVPLWPNTQGADSILSISELAPNTLGRIANEQRIDIPGASYDNLLPGQVPPTQTLFEGAGGSTTRLEVDRQALTTQFLEQRADNPFSAATDLIETNPTTSTGNSFSRQELLASLRGETGDPAIAATGGIGTTTSTVGTTSSTQSTGDGWFDGSWFGGTSSTSSSLGDGLQIVDPYYGSNFEIPEGNYSSVIVQDSFGQTQTVPIDEINSITLGSNDTGFIVELSDGSEVSVTNPQLVANDGTTIDLPDQQRLVDEGLSAWGNRDEIEEQLGTVVGEVNEATDMVDQAGQVRSVVQNRVQELINDAYALGETENLLVDAGTGPDIALALQDIEKVEVVSGDGTITSINPNEITKVDTDGLSALVGGQVERFEGTINMETVDGPVNDLIQTLRDLGQINDPSGTVLADSRIDTTIP